MSKLPTDPYDLLFLLDLIQKRASLLKAKIQRDMVEQGQCPHPDPLEASTYTDYQNRERRWFCPECGTKWKTPFLEGAKK